MECTFKKSESIAKIGASLMLFSVKVGKIKKEASNPFFKSKYASLPNILDAIAEPLQESGLVITQLPEGDGLITMLIHAESGEFLMANSTMHPTKSDPQSMGSAITYQRRYSIGAILNLNIDEDDDGNAASQAAIKQSSENKTELPWLNKYADREKTVLSKEWNAVIVKLQSGERTIADAKARFRISKENLTELETFVKN